MDIIQVHPTGFINLNKPEEHKKILCAELLRGLGGVLISKSGDRFSNELDRRDKIVEKMEEVDSETKRFYLLLSEEAANIANKHMPFYVGKGLMIKFNKLEDAS